MPSFFNQFIENFSFILSTLRWQDVLDIVFVWIIVYRILILVRRTGTVQMLSGLGIVAFAFIASIWLELFTLNWLLDKFFSNLFVIIVVLFQGEIRRALAQIGTNPLFADMSQEVEKSIVEHIAQGVTEITQRGYGALIVIEKDILVDYFIEMGTELDSAISSELLLAIFHPQTPMHDGALLVRNGRAVSAGCFLPLSKNPVLDKSLGTRHRAAIGLTEETDAVVIVVSEETRSISVVTSGYMKPSDDILDLRKELYKAFNLKFRPVLSEGAQND